MKKSNLIRYYEVVYVTVGNPAFFLFLYLTVASTLVQSVSKKLSFDQSELEKYEVSNCKTDYMLWFNELELII